MKRSIVALGSLIFKLRRRRPPQRNPDSIAVIKIGALGDVLMATPFIRALRTSFPHARIIAVVGQWSKPALADNPHLDAVVDFDEAIIWRFRPLALLRLIRKLRRLQVDLGFILDKHWSAAVFAFFCGVSFRVGFDRRGEGFANHVSVPYGPVRHEVEYNLDLLRRLIGERWSMKRDLDVHLTNADNKEAERILSIPRAKFRRFVGLAAGGAQNPNQVAFLKRWPLRHYLVLASLVIKNNPDVCLLLFGGKTDSDVNQQLASAGGAPTVDLSGVPFKTAIALMKKCLVVVTHDSGPMHMAAAAGAPVVSLSGPVHPGRTAPLGGRHINLWKPFLPGALWYDDEGKFPPGVRELTCLVKITPAEVYAVLARYGLKAASTPSR